MSVLCTVRRFACATDHCHRHALALQLQRERVYSLAVTYFQCQTQNVDFERRGFWVPLQVSGYYFVAYA